MEVLEDERRLLETVGHEVRQYTVPAAEDLDLNPVRAGAKAIWNVEAYRAVRAILSEFPADVVHVHTPFPLMSPSVFRAAKASGVPTVATLHSFRYSCIAATCYRDGHTCEDCVGTSTKWPGVRHRCYHDSLGASAALTASLVLHRRLGTFHDCVDRFLALTTFSKRLLIRDGVPANKVIVKANSVPDPGEPQTSGRSDVMPYVAFAGRLLDIKGVDTLLKAWSIAEPQRLRLLVAGDGPLRAQVEAAVDRHVEFRGWLPEQEVTTLLAGAEAVVIPSQWYEGQPLVTLRSLSVGSPVLISDLENLSDDVVADNAGLTFKVGDAQSLADRLNQIDRDPTAVSSLRSNARDSYLRRHTPTQNRAHLETIYREVAGAGT